MANEVIIEEYSNIGMQVAGAKAAQIAGVLIKTTTVSIAAAAFALDATTAFLRVQSKGTGFWYATGGASVTVTANTSPARWLPADQFRDIAITPGTDLKIITAA
jgi:secreted PhoX family phosphatase